MWNRGDSDLIIAPNERSVGVIKLFTNQPLGTVNICANFHGYLAGSCWIILIFPCYIPLGHGLKAEHRAEVVFKGTLHIPWVLISSSQPLRSWETSCFSFSGVLFFGRDTGLSTENKQEKRCQEPLSWRQHPTSRRDAATVEKEDGNN